MAYVAWSVTFGEQPSAAKWNILGTNDASFNDGSGFANGAIGSTAASIAEAFFRGRKQVVTTNSQPTGQTVQFGWAYGTGSGSSDNITVAKTFPQAFSAAPFLIINGIGQLVGSNPSAISDLVTASNTVTTSNSITTTGFNAWIKHVDGTNIGATVRVGFSWIAIGTV